MMRKRLYNFGKKACVFAAAFLIVIMTQVPAAASAPEAEAVADTSVKLLRYAAGMAGVDQNVLISPDSILTAMAMAENGAAGRTLSEIEAAFGGISAGRLTRFLTNMHRRLQGSDKITYRPANSLWFNKSRVKLKKAYVNKMTEDFRAEVYGDPFTPDTVGKINAWVNEKTFGKIPSIIQRLDPDDVLLLINAVYFKGGWTEPFTWSTRKNFTKAGGGVQKAEMMSGEEHAYVQIDGAKGFVKDYIGGQTAFMALLPPKGTSVAQFLKGITGEDLINGYKNRMTSGILVDIRVPEFSYDFELSLVKPLKKLGIRRAFQTTGSNFSRISKTSLSIDDVIHKTHIELNKEGTEAAAATVVAARENAAFPAPDVIRKKVYLNRPFVYAILDTRTAVPLFLGIVNSI